jgi:hypothetical protein
MVDSSDTLRYVGTVLIGFQLVSKMGYIQSFINLALAMPIRRLVNSLPSVVKGESVPKKGGLLILGIFSVILLSVGTLALSPFLLAEILIGRPLVFLNSLLNWLLLRLMEPWKEIYFAEVRASVKGMRIRHKPTDRRLWDIAKKTEVPFIGLSGIICVTLGFIMKAVVK